MTWLKKRKNKYILLINDKLKKFIIINKKQKEAILIDFIYI